LESKIGIDPEHLVTDTHNYVEGLTEQKNKT